MRRMNYNPFEKPFASGELNKDANTQFFVLDKNLEVGFYIITIYDYEFDEYLTALLNVVVFEDGVSSTSSLMRSKNSGYAAYLQVGDSVPNNLLWVYYNEAGNSISDGSTVNIYKLN